MTETEERFGRPVAEFRGVALPEPARLAGYSALIARYELQIPLPRQLAAIGTRRNPSSSDRWRLVTNRQAVPAALGEQLEFALKHEGVNLSVPSALFEAAPKKDFETWISATPGGANTRRVWLRIPL